MVRSLEANSFEMQGTTRLVNSASSSFVPICTSSKQRSDRLLRLRHERVSAGTSLQACHRLSSPAPSAQTVVQAKPARPPVQRFSGQMAVQADQPTLFFRSLPVSRGTCRLSTWCLLQRPWLCGKVTAAWLSMNRHNLGDDALQPAPHAEAGTSRHKGACNVVEDGSPVKQQQLVVHSVEHHQHGL